MFIVSTCCQGRSSVKSSSPGNTSPSKPVIDSETCYNCFGIDRKFNVVVFRHKRQMSDFDRFASILSSLKCSVNRQSIRDIVRLGKYSPSSTRPIKVVLNSTADVSDNYHEEPIVIESDLSSERHKLEAALYVEKKRLVDSGVSIGDVRFKGIVRSCSFISCDSE